MSRRNRRHLEPFEAEITALGPKGVGLGTAPDGRPVRVKGAAPGTRVQVRVTGRKRGVWQARRLWTVRPAPGGVVPRCAIADACGGCLLQELSPEAQGTAKGELALREVAAGMEIPVERLRAEVALHPVRPAPRAWGYRNKVELSFGVRRYLSDQELADGLPFGGRFLGFHAPGRFDKVVDAARCELIDEGANRLLEVVRAHALHPEAPPPWDPRTHTGFWRHLVLRQGQRTGERFAVFVTASPDPFPGAEAAVERLAAALRDEPGDGSRLVGLQWWIHDGVADVARGTLRRAWGAPGWTERLGPLRLALGPRAFFQTNTLGAEILYRTVGEALGPGGGTLVDLYCGIGSLGLFLADRYDQVEGVEEVEDAVVAARSNAEANGVRGRWRVARVEEALDAIRGGASVDLVVDPPRAGLHPKVAARLGQTRARALVYVACNPRSLGRDAARMPGWRLKALWVVDLFPHTGHVECVGRFEEVPR